MTTPTPRVFSMRHGAASIFSGHCVLIAAVTIPVAQLTTAAKKPGLAMRASGRRYAGEHEPALLSFLCGAVAATPGSDHQPDSAVICMIAPGARCGRACHLGSPF